VWTSKQRPAGRVVGYRYAVAKVNGDDIVADIKTVYYAEKAERVGGSRYQYAANVCSVPSKDDFVDCFFGIYNNFYKYITS
jgi:hypothetical protein